LASFEEKTMTDKIDDLANELYEIWLQRKELENKEQVLKDAIKKYLEKADLTKYTSSEYILELTHRTEYGVPTSKELRKAMGDIFAAYYIKEVVDKAVRNDLPPIMQNKLCPIIKDTVYIAVKPRKIGE
jgi:hypothetical protein